MRYLKITLSGVALFLVYLWVSILLNSCNNTTKVNEDSSDDIELLEDEMGGIDYTEDEFEGENEGESQVEDSDDMDMEVKDNEEYEEEDDYVAGDYTSSEPAKTRLEPRKRKEERTFEATTYNDQGTSYGEYMVIAGSYLLEDNAKNMINKLKRMGYSNAEIVYFDQSQYHSICAGRYDSRSSAASTSSRLKNDGIDSYVHRKQD